MATEREFHEATARCISIIVYFHNARRSETTRAAMTGEVQAIAQWITKLPASAGEAERRLFKAVDQELVARYDRSTANRLVAEFLIAFKSGAALSRPAPLVRNTSRL